MKSKEIRNKEVEGYILICFLTVFPACFAVIPELLLDGDQFFLVGDFLNLTCHVPKNTLPAPLRLEKICRQEENCSHQSAYGSESVSIIKEHVTIDDNGTYVCRWNNSNRHANYKIIVIGYSTTKPDLFCVSNDWLNMICSVNLSPTDRKNPLATDWTLFFAVDGGQMTKCIKKEEGRCTWPSSFDVVHDSEYFHPLAQYNIVVNVRNIKSSSNFSFIINPKEIIKPSKVTSLRVNRIGTQGVALSWIQEPLIPAISMQYDVIYRSQWDNQSQKVTINALNNTSLSTALTDLTPYTTYTIACRGKPVHCGQRYWSEEVHIVLRTGADVPGVSPKSIAGGYFVPKQAVNTNEVLVFLYLKPVPERYKHSENIYYEITIVNQTGKFGDVRDIVNKVQGAPITVKLGLPDSSDKVNRLDVRACNKAMGCSVKNVAISIPPLSARGIEYPLADDVVIESYKEGTYLISWDVHGAVKLSLNSVVYVWCRAINMDDRVCKSHLSWVETKVSTNHTLVLPSGTSRFRDWIFGVAIVADNGLSAGLTFSECMFIVHGDVKGVGKPTFNLLLVNGDYTKLVVSFTFTFCDSQLFRSKPMWYKVYYKERSQTGCTKDAKLQTVEASKSTRNVTLLGLQPGVTYSVCMVVVTRHGTSEPSAAQNKTLQSVRPNHSLIVISIMIGFVVFVMITAAVIRYCYLKWKSIDDKIEDVYIPSNLEKLLPEEVNKDSGLPDSSLSSTFCSSKCQDLRANLENSGAIHQHSDENRESNELQEISPSSESNIKKNVECYVRATLDSENETELFNHLHLNGDSDGIVRKEGTSVTEYSTKYGVISDSESGSGSCNKNEQLNGHGNCKDNPYVAYNAEHM